MSTDWHENFILTPAIAIPAERAALYRAAARGEFVRVRRSVYVPAAYWAGLDYDGRHRARIRAAQLLDPSLVFSHLSAALLWNLPVVGGDLSVPHALGDHSSGSRSRTGLRRHAIGAGRHITIVDGVPVTGLAETCAHVAAGYDPEVSVPTLDAALVGDAVSREEILELLSRTPRSGGAVRGAWATRFADPRSGSPGESLSRVAIHRLRLPAPELQVRVEDVRGLAGVADFYWPDIRLVGEFDGVGKYLREGLTGGREPGRDRHGREASGGSDPCHGARGGSVGVGCRAQPGEASSHPVGAWPAGTLVADCSRKTEQCATNVTKHPGRLDRCGTPRPHAGPR